LKRTAESAEFRCSPPQLTLSGPKIQSKMTDGHPSEFFKWWIVDERRGKQPDHLGAEARGRGESVPGRGA